MTKVAAIVVSAGLGKGWAKIKRFLTWEETGYCLVCGCVAEQSSD